MRWFYIIGRHHLWWSFRPLPFLPSACLSPALLNPLTDSSLCLTSWVAREPARGTKSALPFWIALAFTRHAYRMVNSLTSSSLCTMRTFVSMQLTSVIGSSITQLVTLPHWHHLPPLTSSGHWIHLRLLSQGRSWFRFFGGSTSHTQTHTCMVHSSLLPSMDGRHATAFCNMIGMTCPANYCGFRTHFYSLTCHLIQFMSIAVCNPSHMAALCTMSNLYDNCLYPWIVYTPDKRSRVHSFCQPPPIFFGADKSDPLESVRTFIVGWNCVGTKCQRLSFCDHRRRQR